VAVERVVVVVATRISVAGRMSPLSMNDSLPKKKGCLMRLIVVDPVMKKQSTVFLLMLMLALLEKYFH
jgi:hypothetical protein